MTAWEKRESRGGEGGWEIGENDWGRPHYEVTEQQQTAGQMSEQAPSTEKMERQVWTWEQADEQLRQVRKGRAEAEGRKKGKEEEQERGPGTKRDGEREEGRKGEKHKCIQGQTPSGEKSRCCGQQSKAGKMRDSRKIGDGWQTKRTGGEEEETKGGKCCTERLAFQTSHWHCAPAWYQGVWGYLVLAANVLSWTKWVVFFLYFLSTMTINTSWFQA
jgi:hypothetical protein